jgi:hypothetical protein
MFSVQLLDSDDFLSMPMSTQALYMHLALRADDDGFVGNPKRIVRMVSANEDELKLLLAKHYIIPFESGVCVIRHWRIHNYIQSDRHTTTIYLEERKSLRLGEDKAYEVIDPNMDTKCIQDVSNLDAQVRLGKDRLGEVREDKGSEDKKNTRFTPPTLSEVQAYCAERQNRVSPQGFIDFYESKGWMVGKNRMVSWKAAVRNWEQHDNARIPQRVGNPVEYDT